MTKSKSKPAPRYTFTRTAPRNVAASIDERRARFAKLSRYERCDQSFEEWDTRHIDGLTPIERAENAEQLELQLDTERKLAAIKPTSKRAPAHRSREAARAYLERCGATAIADLDREPSAKATWSVRICYLSMGGEVLATTFGGLTQQAAERIVCAYSRRDNDAHSAFAWNAAKYEDAWHAFRARDYSGPCVSPLVTREVVMPSESREAPVRIDAPAPMRSVIPRAAQIALGLAA